MIYNSPIVLHYYFYILSSYLLILLNVRNDVKLGKCSYGRCIQLLLRLSSHVYSPAALGRHYTSPLLESALSYGKSSRLESGVCNTLQMANA